MNDTPACPHCGRSIEPPPKRSRKCPHCRQPIVVRRGYLLTEAKATEFEQRLADEKERRKAEKRDDRFHWARGLVADQLREAKASGVVVGMKLLVSSDACRVCMKVRSKVFPIATCTIDMLPPYRDCLIEDGCDSSVVEILSPEYGGPRRRSKSPKVKPAEELVFDFERQPGPGLIRLVLITGFRILSAALKGLARK